MEKRDKDQDGREGSVRAKGPREKEGQEVEGSAYQVAEVPAVEGPGGDVLAAEAPLEPHEEVHRLLGVGRVDRAHELLERLLEGGHLLEGAPGEGG